MPSIEIASLDDPRLDPFRDLKKTNATRWSGVFVAEGDKLARRLLASRFPVRALAVEARHASEFAALAPPGTPVYAIPHAFVDRLVGFNFHRGVLACGERLPPADLASVAPAGDAAATVVVCPEIHDPENLGAMLRLSAAFAVDGLLLGPLCADPLSRRVLRTSMGAVLSLPWRKTADVSADLRDLKGRGYELAATVLDANAEPLAGARRPKKLALLFGSEGHGLPVELAAACDRRLTIPMPPATDSLNVAVAAGIFLHHFGMPASHSW